MISSSTARGATSPATGWKIKSFAFGGLAGDVFVTGDWNASPGPECTRIGLWGARCRAAQRAPIEPRGGPTFGYGGVAGDVPVTGKW